MSENRIKVRRAKHRTRPRIPDSPYNWIVEDYGASHTYLRRFVYDSMEDAIGNADFLARTGLVDASGLVGVQIEYYTHDNLPMRQW
jgi:hypothetical protein